jgi:uncharacterized protein YjbJ (UPF0337 family)
MSRYGESIKWQQIAAQIAVVWIVEPRARCFPTLTRFKGSRYGLGLRRERRNSRRPRVSPLKAESQAMNKNRIDGSIKEVTGAAKETVGKVFGDAKLQSDGKTEKAVGKIQNAVGGVNDAVKEALKKP